MTDSTYYKLRQLCIDLLNIGRSDGEISHEPDTFLKQGIEHQLAHALVHLEKEAMFDTSEHHVAHAFCRLLFYQLMKEESNG